MFGRYSGITYASAENARSRKTRGGNGYDIGYRGCPRCDLIWRTMGSADLRHHLHGDDRQPAIRLDAVRQSDRTKISLEPGEHPGRLHAVRSLRYVVGADRRLFDRPTRTQGDDFRQW